MPRKLNLIPLKENSKLPLYTGWQHFVGEVTTKNIGLRCGEYTEISDKQIGYLLVIDFDSPSMAMLKLFCKKFKLPYTTLVKTGGEHDGYHLYYLVEKVPPRKVGAWRGIHIDVMGKGSFVVMPPSVVLKEYRFLVPLEKIRTLDNIILDRVIYYGDQFRMMEKYLSKVDGVAESSRNIEATKVLGKLCDTKHFDKDMILYGFREWNKKNSPPLDAKELQLIYDYNISKWRSA